MPSLLSKNAILSASLILFGARSGLYAQDKPDTLVRMHIFQVPFGNTKPPIILYKCLGSKKYQINIGENDVDCSQNEISATTSITDFSNLLQESYKEHLVLATEPYLNAHLTDSLFGTAAFKAFLKDYVYDESMVLITADGKAKTTKPAAPAAKAKSKKKAPDSLSCLDCPDITLLNAANFDFTGKLSTSYLAMFNVFAPNLDNGRFGFMTGIQKINYATVSLNGGSDSSNVQYFQQNYLLNPLMVNRQLAGDPVLPGAQYIQEYNQYSFATSNRVWSVYFQPLYKFLALSEKFPKDGMYVHIHLELLINQWTQTSTIKNLYTNPDTAVTTTLARDSGFYWVKNNPVIVNKDFLTGNFGAGVSYYHHLADRKSDTSMHIFAQATIGWSVNSPNFDLLNNPTAPPHPNGTLLSNGTTDAFFYPKAKAFFLTRFHFVKAISPGSELYVGFESRGVFASPNVQYALYLGLNLDISKLAGLIAGGD